MFRNVSNSYFQTPWESRPSFANGSRERVFDLKQVLASESSHPLAMLCYITDHLILIRSTAALLT